MIHYIKTIFTKPKEIYTGRNMKNSHFFSFLFLLTLLLTVLSIFEFIPLVNTMNEDITEVKDSIPTFELVSDELESDSESYVYQTDTLFLYFDPEDKMTSDTIDRNMASLPVPLSVGIMNDHLYLNIVGQNLSLRYADFDNFTTADLESLIATLGQFSTPMVLMFVALLFLFTFILFLMQFFPITLFANIISVYRRTGLRFFQSAKIALLATIGPILVLYTINTFVFPVRFQFELLLVASLTLYYMSITEMKKRIDHTNETESNQE